MQEEETGAEAPEAETPEGQAERPEWLDEKFNSPEDMAKAYKELEKKQGEENPEDTPEDKANEEETPQEGDFKVGGVDMSDYAKEFAEGNKLSEESYEKLAKEHGYPKEVVDTYIKGRMAAESEVGQNLNEAYYAPVGGEENYDKMLDWASSNVSQSEKAVFNKINDSGDKDAIKLNVANMYSKYQKATGKAPALTKGGTTPTKGDVYTSTAQMSKDMASPAYKTDPAFRKKVEDKLMRSSII